MLYIKDLRKDYSRYEHLVDMAKDCKPVEMKLIEFLNWNKNTNFSIRFDTIIGVEFHLFGFNAKSLYDLDETIRNLDFDKVSESNKRLFLKFTIEDLLNMYIIDIRNGYFGASVEILIDYQRFVQESCNLFMEEISSK